MFNVTYKHFGHLNSKTFADYAKAKKFFYFATFKMKGVTFVELKTP